MLRWQKLHPETYTRGQEGLLQILGALEGTTASGNLWESVILPHRIGDYQPRWIDELLAGGEWLWHGQRRRSWAGRCRLPCARLNSGTSPPRIADDGMPRPESLDAVRHEASSNAEAAQFVTDLASHRTLRLRSSAPTRCGVWSAFRWRRTTTSTSFAEASNVEAEPASRVGLRSLRDLLLACVLQLGPKGRWSLSFPGLGPTLRNAARGRPMLLDRYGIACRDLALLDAHAAMEKILYEVLSRLELSDEVRKRGYFVEGLSGAQFALPEASRMLQELASPSQAAAPPVLVHSLDPANLFGSGAFYPLPDERQVCDVPATGWSYKLGSRLLPSNNTANASRTCPAFARSNCQPLSNSCCVCSIARPAICGRSWSWKNGTECRSARAKVANCWNRPVLSAIIKR
ncbi:MAG: hypothetical protein U0744_09045 [Gemmataceae bacterium]